MLDKKARELMESQADCRPVHQLKPARVPATNSSHSMAGVTRWEGGGASTRSPMGIVKHHERFIAPSIGAITSRVIGKVRFADVELPMKRSSFGFDTSLSFATIWAMPLAALVTATFRFQSAHAISALVEATSNVRTATSAGAGSSQGALANVARASLSPCFQRRSIVARENS